MQSGNADFEVILVYDVSRWGRFQDTDESGYLEFLCRRAKIRIEYCAEEFKNDGSSFDTLLKNIKRTMAAEYSRDLSVKMHKALCKVVSMGYFGGGKPNYGLRRMLLGPSGEHRFILEKSTRKAIKGERTVLVPGPRKEVNAVRKIFRLYVNDRFIPSQIATYLNRQRIFTAEGNEWKAGSIRTVLATERYAGILTYNRSSKKLHGPRQKNNPTQWIRTPGAMEPIIPAELFANAQSILAERRAMVSRNYSQDSLSERLKYLHQQNGYLTGAIITADKAGPSLRAYIRAFGNLSNAYQQIGFDSPHKKRAWQQSKKIRRKLFSELAGIIKQRGWHCNWDEMREIVVIENVLTLGLAIGWYHATDILRKPSWRVRFRRTGLPDLTIIPRLDFANQDVLDYFLMPREYLKSKEMRLDEPKQGDYALLDSSKEHPRLLSSLGVRSPTGRILPCPTVTPFSPFSSGGELRPLLSWLSP